MVSRILLNEFDKSDGEIWARNQEALLVRLQCPYSPYPKRKIPKYAKPIFLTRQRRDLWPVSTFRFDRNDPSSLETQLNTGVIQVGISLDEGYSEEDFYALAKVLERFFHIKVRFFDALHSGEGRHVSQPSTIPVVEALKYFSAVHHLRLVRLTEDVTSILATFSSLVTLGIGGKGMTVDPELFNHLRQLHGLSLWQCAGIEDTQFLSGLSGLRELRLSYIDLDEIAEISKLHELERLSLGSLKLRTFPSLASLTKLRRISLMNVGSATDLAQIAEAPSLEQLLISSGPHFTEEHLKPFKDHPSLREFICAKSASNPDSAERIQRFMNLPKPNCHDWHIF